MAAKKFGTEEERIEFIKLLSDYFIENNSSTRKVGKVFDISNVTTYEYLALKLPKIDMERYIRVLEILSRNKPNTKYDNDIKTRLNDIYECIFTNNMTIEATSNHLDISEKTIYNDILKFDSLRLNNIKNILKRHSAENSPYIK